MATVIRNTKRTLIFLIALVCVVLGLIGIVLPIVPGLVFLAIALIIFSLFFPIIGEKMRHHTKRYPALHDTIEKLDEWVRRQIGDI